MSRPSTIVRALVWAVVGAGVAAVRPGSAAAQLPSADSLAALVSRSPFVFVASAVAPSVPVVPRGPVLRHISKLRVVEPIAVPRGFRLRAGDQVRLVTYAADAPPIGSRAVVFATGWIAEDTLSLGQVARFTLRTVADQRSVKASYDSLRLAQRRDALRQAVGAASLATVAVVDSVVAVPDERPPIARSEHDPVWALVAITPIRVEKGDTTLVGRPVRLLIPTNHSGYWSRIPRLARGDTVFFVLASIAPGLVIVDRNAQYQLGDSVAVRPAADTTLLRAPR